MYKRPFQTIEDGPVTGLVSPMSLLCFLDEFPSGARRLAKSTYLPQLLSSLRERAQGGALSNIQTGASGPTLMVQISCPEILLDFPVNQVIQPLFSTEISYYTISS